MMLSLPFAAASGWVARTLLQRRLRPSLLEPADVAQDVAPRLGGFQALQHLGIVARKRLKELR